MDPVRIQIKRTPGYRLQDISRAINGLPATKVDRTTSWGNPFRLGEEYVLATGIDPETGWEQRAVVIVPDAEAAKQLYGIAMMSCEMRRRYNLPSPEEVVRELRGRNLACWCPPDQPCHADVLLEIANDWPDDAIALAQRGGSNDCEPHEKSR